MRRRITEEETVYLMEVGQGRPLSLAFGSAVWLLTEECPWAVEALEAREIEALRKEISEAQG